MKSRLVSIILSFVMLISIVPVFSLPVSAEKTCDGGSSCPTSKYLDVPAPSNWAHVGIDFCVSKGLMSSTSTDRLIFSPNAKTSRAMIVVILYRLEGSPKVSYQSVFDDVPSGKWFSNGIIWAQNNDIVTGYGNRRFGPNDVITREQLATIMQRYTTFKGRKTKQIAPFSSFPDCTSVSSWAERGIAWAVGFGLIKGKGTSTGTILDPKGFATRAETATILMRYIQRQEELEPLDDPTMCTHTWLFASHTNGTCIKEGTITYFCGDCNAEYTEKTWKGDHNYSVKTTAPTCTRDGYDTYTCSVCGYSYTTNRTSALGHNYVNGFCSRCGAADPYIVPAYNFPFYLYSNDGKVYLGKLVTNQYDSESVWNEYGTYGSKYSQYSIWNEYGTYGSSYSNESAFNNYALNPPIIVDARGNIMGYLTTNTTIYYGYTITQIRQFLLSYYQ